MKTAIRQGIGALVLMGAVAAPAADDYRVDQEHWYEGAVEDWIDSDPGGRMEIQWSPGPFGQHTLAGFYNALPFPFPETDSFIADALSSGGRFTGDYYAGGLLPHTLSFKFLAEEVLPSSLLLRFFGVDGGMTNSFFTSLTGAVSTTGEWAYLSVPLTYDTNVWTGGSGSAFTNSLGDVQWVEVRVTRSGEAAQAYYLDDFALTRQVPAGIAMIDSDGDGLPDFWEEQHYGDPTNGVAGADDDGDGDTALQEFVGQTDPNQVLSRVIVARLEHSLDFDLLFEGELGRRYEFESKADPFSPVWTLHTNQVDGIGSLMSFSFTNDVSGSWFRIRASRP